MVQAILVTGRPGVGKTTLVRAVAARLPDRAGGFYTSELREQGERLGFELVTLDGRRGLMASAARRGGPRVGKYGVDLGVIETLGVGALRDAMAASELVVVDEIGKMELLSPAFVATLRELFTGPYHVLGSIMEKPHPVADEIKRLPGVKVLEVTAANRDALVEEILREVAPRS
jgi:nucleoside-triphosphatase